VPAGDRLVYGLHAVAELLRNPRAEVHAVFVAPKDHEQGDGPLAALREQAARRGLHAIEKSRGELDRLAQGGVHQGVVALCGAFRYAEGVAPLVERAEQAGEAPLLLVLDGVTDPQNLGALVRSTYVLSGHGVVVPRDRAAAVTPAAVKAAAGATELLPIAQVPNLVRAMEDLKEHGVWLIAAVAPGQGGQPPWTIDLCQPSAFVLGSEGGGLRPLVRKTCELRVEIPMLGGLHGASLNVSAAGAVLLYEALRQRRVAAGREVAQ
jgi:23S rRNA (guanosine2251-2'-O)-methyltransferase